MQLVRRYFEHSTGRAKCLTLWVFHGSRTIVLALLVPAAPAVVPAVQVVPVVLVVVVLVPLVVLVVPVVLVLVVPVQSVATNWSPVYL